MDSPLSQPPPSQPAAQDDPGVLQNGQRYFDRVRPAELLDNLLVRPLFMFVEPQLIGPYAVGVFVGKIAADLVFYSVAVIGYEARKRWFGG